MSEILSSNTFFCIFLTLAAFEAGRAMQKKWKSPLLNPLLVGTVLVCTVLTVFGISVDTYQAGCAPMQFLLTPATICFSVSLYEQIGRLKKHLVSIAVGVAGGAAASLISIRAMAALFRMDRVLTVSLLPKSITTAFGMALSQEAGGIAALTTAAIVVTGILGNMLGPWMCEKMKITDPIAQGVSFGTASHAIGTVRASQISELTGAVSSLSLTLAGLVTVVLFSFFV